MLCSNVATSGPTTYPHNAIASRKMTKLEPNRLRQVVTRLMANPPNVLSQDLSLVVRDHRGWDVLRSLGSRLANFQRRSERRRNVPVLCIPHLRPRPRKFRFRWLVEVIPRAGIRLHA